MITISPLPISVIPNRSGIYNHRFFRKVLTFLFSTETSLTPAPTPPCLVIRPSLSLLYVRSTSLQKNEIPSTLFPRGQEVLKPSPRRRHSLHRSLFEPKAKKMERSPQTLPISHEPAREQSPPPVPNLPEASSGVPQLGGGPGE